MTNSTPKTDTDDQRQNRTPAPGELDDQELDKVSGGVGESLSLNFAQISWKYSTQSNP